MNTDDLARLVALALRRDEIARTVDVGLAELRVCEAAWARLVEMPIEQFCCALDCYLQVVEELRPREW